METMHSVLKKSGDTLPALVGVRPMLMLTGFLGAGKTTRFCCRPHGVLRLL